jgi:hypothetical protein
MRRAAAGLLDVLPGVGLGQAEEGVGRQEQLGGRQQRAVLVARQQAEAALRVGPERLSGGVERAVRDQARGRGQVVEQRRRLVEK